MADLLPRYKAVLMNIFYLLYKKKYKEAEIVLVKNLEKIVDLIKKKKANGPQSSFCKSIYFDFNENYLNWIKSIGENHNKEISSLHSTKHDNFLLASCADAASMDDLLYELLDCLTNNGIRGVHKEAQYQLTCYKKSFFAA